MVLETFVFHGGRLFVKFGRKVTENIAILLLCCLIMTPLEQRLVQIFKKFSDQALMYGSRLLKSTFQMACWNPNSVYCSNVNEAEQILAAYNSEDNALQCTIDILRDLLVIRDGMKECDLFQKMR